MGWKYSIIKPNNLPPDARSLGTPAGLLSWNVPERQDVGSFPENEDLDLPRFVLFDARM